MGPGAAETAQRIEEMIEEIGGSTSTISSWASDEDEDHTDHHVVARHNRSRYDDRVYGETTLPPQ
jgi:hypothetical protein